KRRGKMDGYLSSFDARACRDLKRVGHAAPTLHDRREGASRMRRRTTTSPPPAGGSFDGNTTVILMLDIRYRPVPHSCNGTDRYQTRRRSQCATRAIRSQPL